MTNIKNNNKGKTKNTKINLKDENIHLTNLANLLFEVGSLRKIPRAHRQNLLTNDVSDNLSSHLYRVTWIGYFLAKELNADPYKVMLMCMIHDLPEARSGDMNWIHKKYVKVYEDEIIKDQLDNTKQNVKEELINTYNEYEKRESLEATLAKDADLIDQMLLLKEHAHGGNKEAENWLALEDIENRNKQYKLLRNDISKKLAKEILNLSPSKWWQNIYTSNRR